MKKILTITALMLAMVINTACAKQIFKSVPSGKGVEKTYIGSALLNIANSVMNIDGMGYIGEGSKVSSLEVVEIDRNANSKVAGQARDLLSDYVNSNHLEELMCREDEDETVTIYGLLSEDGQRCKTLIVCTDEKSELQIVVVNGDISLGDTDF